MDDSEVYQLAKKIYDNIAEDFAAVHLSKNLVETMKIVKTDRGYKIEIPARQYDMYMYIKHGVFAYNGTGSYATIVEKTGGLSGTHKNYVDKAISKAVTSWSNLLGVTVKRSETK